MALTKREKVVYAEIRELYNLTDNVLLVLKNEDILSCHELEQLKQVKKITQGIIGRLDYKKEND